MQRRVFASTCCLHRSLAHGRQRANYVCLPSSLHQSRRRASYAVRSVRPVCIQFVCARTPESELCLFAVFHTTCQHHKSVFEVCSSQSSLHQSSLKFKVCDSSVVCIDHLFASIICLHRSWCTLSPHNKFSSHPGVLFASIRAIELASVQPISHRGGSRESFSVAPRHPRVFLHPSHPRPIDHLCFPSPFCIALSDVCILSVHRLLFGTPLKVCRIMKSPGWMDSLLSKDLLST